MAVCDSYIGWNFADNSPVKAIGHFWAGQGVRENISMKQFFSVLDTEDRENHSEILLNGSFSSPTTLGQNRWDWF